MNKKYHLAASIFLVILLTSACKNEQKRSEINEQTCIETNDKTVRKYSTDTIETVDTNKTSLYKPITNDKDTIYSEWLNKVKQIADWYNKNFDGYQDFLNGKWCPLVNKKVRDDCSGMVTACLVNYGIYEGNTIYNSGSFRDKDCELGKLLKKHFLPIQGEFMQTDYEKFKAGDVLAGYMFEDGKVQKQHGHVTVYAGNGKFYDWGGWAYKAKSQPVAGEESEGFMHDHLYTIIWRVK